MEVSEDSRRGLVELVEPAEASVSIAESYETGGGKFDAHVCGQGNAYTKRRKDPVVHYWEELTFVGLPPAG